MKQGSFVRSADWGFLALLILASCVIAGVSATLYAWLTWLLLALPGLVLLHRSRPTLAQWALASLSGIAVTLLVSILVGLILGELPLPLMAAIAAVLALAANSIRRREAIRAESALPETLWELVVPLIALSLAVLPLYQVGSEFAGAHHFHAFFNADYFKHIAHSEELARGEFPPLNPFAAGQGLHYYWAFYLLPATVIRLSGFDVSGVEALLAVGLLQTGTLGLLAFGLCYRLSGGGAKSAAVAVILTLLSLSWDGLAALLDWGIAQQTGRAVAMINQEKLEFTAFFGADGHLAGSTWQRLCLYLPQHQLALLLFFAWAWLFAVSGSERSDTTRWLRVLLLLPMPLISFLVGLLAAVTMVLCELFRDPRFNSALIWGAALVLALCLLVPAGILSITPSEHALDPFLSRGYKVLVPLSERIGWMLPQLVTTFGVTLPLGVAGIGLLLSAPRRERSLIILPGITLSVALLCYLVAELLLEGRLRVETELKTSFLLLAGLMMGSTLFLSRLPPVIGVWRLFYVVCLMLLLGGVASPVHDLVWHASFQPAYDVAVPEADMQALRWIRKNTPVDTVFQQPLEAPFLLGGRDAWVAVIGARRVAVTERAGGVAETLLSAARELFDPLVSRETRARDLQQLQVDYIYLSRSQLKEAFEQLTDLFTTEGGRVVYRNADVVIVEHSHPMRGAL